MLLHGGQKKESLTLKKSRDLNMVVLRAHQGVLQASNVSWYLSEP